MSFITFQLHLNQPAREDGLIFLWFFFGVIGLTDWVRQEPTVVDVLVMGGKMRRETI